MPATLRTHEDQYFEARLVHQQRGAPCGCLPQPSNTTGQSRVKVNLYRIGEGAAELKREIVFEEVTEDIRAIEVCVWKNQLFLAGELGMIYRQAIDRECPPLVRTLENQTLKMMHGHFKCITHLQSHPNERDLLLSCSLDFSVRLWNTAKGKPFRFISGRASSSDLCGLGVPELRAHMCSKPM